MANATIQTRILILSDTHCARLSSASSGAAFRGPLPVADLAIHCGDLTHTGTAEQYAQALDLLREIDAPVKLVIAGNHDRTLDRDFVLTHRGEYGTAGAEEVFTAAREVWTGREGRARREGVTFLDEGTHVVELANGASVKVYASAYTPEFQGWAFPYESYEDRFNSPGASLSDAKNIAPYPVPSFSLMDRPVDVMITHGPPYGRLDATKDGDLVGCPHLLRALMRARPLMHCFGHIHEGRGAERVRWAAEADDVVAKATSTKAWTTNGWKQGVKDIKAETQEWGFGDAQPGNAALVDVSRAGGQALARGEETLLVNASIMNVNYRPSHGPWLLHLDLPLAPSD